MTGVDPISDIAVPAIVWLLMLIVGFELTLADFRRVLVYRRAVAVATVGQVLLLPLIAAILILMLDLAPYITAGMILVAASPGGAISNLYTYLARANVALSVTLTAVSSLIALVTMPLLTATGFALFLDYHETVDVPIARMTAQLALMLVLPVSIGMVLRDRYPSVITRYGPWLRRLSLLALAALVGIVLLDQEQNIADEIGPVITAAILFTMGAMAVGWGIGRVTRMDPENHLVFLLEFSARNLAITTVIGVTVLGRVEFVLFSALFFLTQVPILLLLVSAYARRSNRKAFVAPNV